MLRSLDFKETLLTHTRPNRLIPIAAGAIFSIVTLASAQEPKMDPKLDRGKYLVEQVARCQECHTATLPDGSFDKTQWMKGATLVGIPAKPIEDWHQKAPDITSTSKLWERWKVEGFVKFFQTARTPRGGKSGPPMPGYTMAKDDAEAVTAYLKSLP